MENKILSLIHYGEAKLSEAGITSAKYEAEILLSYVLKKTRLKLYTDIKGFIPQEKEEEYKQLLGERSKRKPLQYILGSSDFYGFKFKVNENVLIPRPETEVLVEGVIDRIVNCFEKKISVLDIGTGSGNIPISIAKSSSMVDIYAMDNSAEALEIAKYNARENGLEGRIKFIQMSIYDDYAKLKEKVGHVDIITSNPPYIPTEQIKDLMPEISEYEPRAALDGGEDGLEIIKKILLVANGLLRYNGALFLEIWDGQKETVQSFAKKYFSIDFNNDLSGTPRVLIAEKRN
ncbi:peptide chain release factor N(5)-glutamine methyltransferase [bacterium]|nr:peptide chain release factor N(5)-glutamine methyltransferase [bacterium]